MQQRLAGQGALLPVVVPGMPEKMIGKEVRQLFGGASGFLEVGRQQEEEARNPRGATHRQQCRDDAPHAPPLEMAQSEMSGCEVIQQKRSNNVTTTYTEVHHANADAP